MGHVQGGMAIDTILRTRWKSDSIFERLSSVSFHDNMLSVLANSFQKSMLITHTHIIIKLIPLDDNLIH